MRTYFKSIKFIKKLSSYCGGNNIYIFIHTSNDIKKLLETFFTVRSNNCEAKQRNDFKV